MGVYVRKDRKKDGRTYYYLVSSQRRGKRVVQRRLEYLGARPTEEEIAKAKTRAAEMFHSLTDSPHGSISGRQGN